MKKLLLVLTLVLSISAPVNAASVATIPTYDTYINGKLYDNTREKYPMLNYKGVTYVPLKYTLLRSMGLDTLWNQNTKRLFVYNSGDVVLYETEPTGNYRKGQKINLEATDFELYQNPSEDEGENPTWGKIDLNSYGDYPLLFYKNLIYVPLTYDIFNLKFQFNSERLDIDSRNSVQGLLFTDGKDVYKLVGDKVYRKGYEEKNYVKIGNIGLNSRAHQHGINSILIYPDGALIRLYIPRMGVMQPEAHYILHRDRVEEVKNTEMNFNSDIIDSYIKKQKSAIGVLGEFGTNPSIIGDRVFLYNLESGTMEEKSL